MRPLPYAAFLLSWFCDRLAESAYKRRNVKWAIRFLSWELRLNHLWVPDFLRVAEARLAQERQEFTGI